MTVTSTFPSPRLRRLIPSIIAVLFVAALGAAYATSLAMGDDITWRVGEPVVGEDRVSVRVGDWTYGWDGPVEWIDTAVSRCSED